MLRQISKKRGITPMIGYVLLVSFAIVISTIVYIWMKTYAPAPSLECADGVSVMIKEISCTNRM